MLHLVFIATAMYEAIRIFFFLVLQVNLVAHSIPVIWYIATPLLGLPLLLIYIMYIASKEGHSIKILNDVQKTCVHIFGLQKIATITGFIVFLLQYAKNFQVNILKDGIYFIEMIPFMMIFFVIDVILCIVVFLIQSNKEKKAEE